MHFPGGWIRSWDPSLKWALLLHRGSGRSWRWPDAELQVVSTWPGHVLFEEVRRPGRFATGRLMLADTEMQEAGRFSVDPTVSERRVTVSPDGQTLAIDADTRVYLVSVESSRVTMVFETDPDDESARAWIDPMWDGPGIRVQSSRSEGKDTRQYSDHYFNWEGDAVAAPTCPDQGGPRAGWMDGATLRSPDGRHAASLDGAPVFVAYQQVAELQNPWPNVVVFDTATCAPLFRVRSVHTIEFWNLWWLATSEGFVVGSRDGSLLVRVQPNPPVLERLEWAGYHSPEPAPTGDGRYFALGWRVYDAFEDRWVEPPAVASVLGASWWGDSYRERWFLPVDYLGEGWVEWLLLPASLEFPPFSNEIAFLVVRTGDCLHLREEPTPDAAILDCLPEGERVVFVQQEHPSEPGLDAHDLSLVHPSLAGTVGSAWVYVRTEDGVEGWVSHDYLEHD